MTEQEHEMLVGITKRLDKVEAGMVEMKALHDAFLSLPLGADPKEPTLLQDITAVVRDRKRKSWLFRMATVVAPTVLGAWYFWRDLAAVVAKMFRL